MVYTLSSESRARSGPYNIRVDCRAHPALRLASALYHPRGGDERDRHLVPNPINTQSQAPQISLSPLTVTKDSHSQSRPETDIQSPP
jgi:hypothetical protein